MLEGDHLVVVAVHYLSAAKLEPRGLDSAVSHGAVLRIGVRPHRNRRADLRHELDVWEGVNPDGPGPPPANLQTSTAQQAKGGWVG
jgi:hypothetical protein